MPSKLSLYNGALLIVGERALASLSEARESRRLLDTVWDRPAVTDCLEKGLWNFATRSVEITEDPDVTPAFGHTYAFNRPTDLVRTVALCQDEQFSVPLTDYLAEGSYWYANITPIYVRYVSKDNAYGNDLSLWPGNFTRFVEAYLADGIVNRLTNDKGEWQRVNAVLYKALQEAKNTDAMEQPTVMPPPGTWVRSRRGRDHGDRGNRSRLIG